MKVLMVWARFFPEMGGIETHIYEVGKRLQADGHQVSILTTDRTGRLPKREIVSGMEIIRVKAWPSQRDFYFAPGVVSVILSGRWDVVHIQGYHTLVAPMAMLAAWLSAQAYVVTFHSGGHSSPIRRSLRGLQRWLLGPLIRRAAQVVGVSEYEAATFGRALRIDSSRLSVIRNGTNPPAKPLQPAPPCETILSIGRLEKYKGHGRAIQAMPRVLAKRPGVELHIIGDGPFRENLVRLVGSLGLEENVRIYSVEPAKRAALMQQISAAALVVLLSDYEAHPVAVMEALSLGKKVLATHCSGFIELAAKGWIETIPADATPEVIGDAMLAAMVTGSHVDVELPTWDQAVRMIETVYGRAARA